MPDYAAWIVWPALLVVCSALSSLYAGLETGLYVMNKIRLELRAEAGVRPAKLTRRMLNNPSDLLAVLLIGTNLVRYVATFCITSMFVTAGFGQQSEWYTLAVATPLFFVLGDAVPKSVFQRAAESLTYRFIWLLRVSHGVFLATGLTGLVRMVAALPMRLTGADRQGRSPLERRAVAAVVAEGRATGLLTDFQSLMADRVMRIKEVALGDVMRPMTGTVRVPADASRSDVMAVIAKHDYSRLPMCDAAGQVVGLLDTYDVLTEGEAVHPADKARAPRVLPITMTVTDALYRMRRARAAMAVVADRNGRHVGIVTIKDLVEEIVGELEAW